MEVRIKAIHFDIAERLNEFIDRKAERLSRRYSAISHIDFTLKVVKPETSQNKEALIAITIPGAKELTATKVADTFEEAIDLALEALERQLEKEKAKK
ncbi:MAG: ribosome-associated translation inhibitor RaiA [Muribaculaceae bacterium]|nr:ribosome-associated translation inhibitor RaiA [Muribaculaceae bacterium]MDE5967511.1 ribosome-associated translation inhibitor RaiA [Muribaculaceae bacterium]